MFHPLIKKPHLDPLSLSNYRPISNSPIVFLCKVLEKVISSQLISFMNNSVFNSFQSGFRALLSTQTDIAPSTQFEIDAASWPLGGVIQNHALTFLC